MLTPPVEHKVNDYEFDPRLPKNKAYGYVMAGNGVFKYADNEHIEAAIQVAECKIKGLPILRPCARLRHDLKLRGNLLFDILKDAKAAGGVETMYQIEMDVYNGNAIVKKPNQSGSATRVHFSENPSQNIVLDIHSHANMDAFFSSTDNRDEQGFRFYGVIGNIFTHPTLKLRIGIYGDYANVPILDLFTDYGPFFDKPIPIARMANQVYAVRRFV